MRHTPVSEAAQPVPTRWSCAPLPGCWGVLGEQGKAEGQLPLWPSLSARTGHPCPTPPQVLKPVISLPLRPPRTHHLSSVLVPHLTTRALHTSCGHSSFAQGPAQPLPHWEQICTLTPSSRGGVPGHIQFSLRPGVTPGKPQVRLTKVGSHVSIGILSGKSFYSRLGTSAFQTERASSSQQQQGVLPACPVLVGRG